MTTGTQRSGQGSGGDVAGEPADSRESGSAVPSFLFNRQFLVLMGITFLTYANISVFFQFYAYLGTLPIDPEWFGLIIGTFAAVSLAVRPLVSPFFHPGNARRFLAIGTVMVIGSLGAYSLAHSLAAMLAVRVFHGLAFVVMGSALMALIIEFIPGNRSAQFFGLLSIVILVPNTIVPPTLPFFFSLFGGFNGVLLAFAAVTAVIFPILTMLKPDRTVERSSRDVSRSLSGREIRENLMDTAVIFLLLAMLMMFCGHAVIFFFLNGFGKTMGFANTGLFLTLTTAGEIGVRLAGGSFLDRMDKSRLLFFTMAGLAAAYIVLARAGTQWLFFGTGAFIGLGWGIAMPVFNGLLFDISKPRFRSMNTNLGMQMFQAGFFIGPFIGGAVVPGWGYGSLFYLCAAMSVAGGLLTLVSGGIRNHHEDRQSH